jgi:Fe-S cluster biogenesis protein NfuA
MSPSEVRSVSPMMEAVQQALEPISKSLQTDGFDLIVESIEQGVVSLAVSAGPEACNECLIPQEHLKLRIEHRLKGLARVVRLRYPEQP